MSKGRDWKDEERQKIDVLEVWKQVQRTIASEQKEKVITRNSRWKTIRIFVSSTFKDFHTERDVLVKEVFPDLREWCQKRDLNLVECDLRWGVPQETPYCITLEICLDEIRRCERENIWPYFLNMTSKRIGFIPIKDELPDDLINKFDLVLGLSTAEMEIVEAAYRKGNPNSLFMYRDESFIESMTDENIRKEFVDELNPIANKKLKILKEKIEARFPSEQIVTYTCSYVPDKKIAFTDRTQLVLSEKFKTDVLDFFKKRIEEDYPQTNNVRMNQMDEDLNQHDAFMQSRANLVLGRKDILEKMMTYLECNEKSKPMVLVGDSGSGKSSIMAKLVYDLFDKIKSSSEQTNDVIFFHFVGAVPNSTELLGMMKRFLHEMKQFDVPCKSEDLYQHVKEFLTMKSGYCSQRKIYMFIDALNQLDKSDLESTESNPVSSWLPCILPAHIKCIISVTPGLSLFQNLQKSENFQIERVPELTFSQRGDIVEMYLSRYRKTLERKQERIFLEKCSLPLWIIVACDELRLFGEFKLLTEYIEKLPDKLDELLLFVLRRICHDIGDYERLLIAFLCLLECSRNGLLEVELLEMLATLDDKSNYKITYKDDKPLKPRLIAWKWCTVFRHLRIFIRPYGNLGEGRLNFYHQSMSDVVRKNYLSSKEQVTKYHSMLADYFESCENIDRKIEEYPYHLMIQEDRVKMKSFLLDWDMFDRFYNSEFCKELIGYWRFIDEDYTVMHDSYKRVWDKMGEFRKDDLYWKKGEELARLFNQTGLITQAYSLTKVCLDRFKDVQYPTAEENKQIMFLSGLLGYLEFSCNHNLDKAIELREKAIRTNGMLPYEEQVDIDIQKNLALQYNQLAFLIGEKVHGMSNIFFQGRKGELRAKGLEACRKSKEIYKTNRAYSHMLDTYISEANLQSCKTAAHEIYEKLIRDCISIHGVEHILVVRASYNNANIYEKEKNYQEAYRSYKVSYLLAKKLLGPKHASTLRYKNILLEPKYQAIMKEKKEDVENMAWGVDCLDLLILKFSASC